MPIYEFRCRQCGRKTTELVLSRERIGEVRCRACGGANLERLWSRFATVRSEESRLDALDDPGALSGVDENDPKSVMRWMKRMGREMGEEVGDDFEAAMEQELSGAPPDGEVGPGSESGGDG